MFDAELRYLADGPLLDTYSASVTRVVDGVGPAARARIRERDIVVVLDGVPVTGADDLIRLLGGERIGRSVELALVSAGRLRTIRVTPGERDRR